MEPVDNDEMQPYTEIPPVSTTTPASLAGVYRGGPTSSIQEAVEVGKTLHRTVPSSLGFPHDTQTLIALGRMTYEQRLEFQFRETKEAKLAYLAEIMKVQPEVQAEARMVVSGLDSNVDALRSLQRFHPLVRCAYLGWVELDKINTVADLMRVYTALMQDKVDPKQWRSAHLKFDQLQAEYNRFMSSTSIAEQNRATVEASLKEQVAVKKHYFPQALWWNRFYDCDGFTADPVKSTFSIGGSEYGVDSFDRVEDRDFDRLVTTLRYFNRGEIVPVRMSVADCIAVGYLTMEYTPEVNVQRVTLRPSMSSATNSPLFRPESTAIRQRIEDVFKACVADIGLVPNVSIKTEWSFYVAYIYAYALATGQLAPLDSNTTFYADVAEWPNHIKTVTDFVENRCKSIWGECNSGGGRAWSAMGNTALYKDQYWVSLSHAFSGTQQRRSRVNVRSQTLTRMMDICKGSFGHPHLDGLTELKYLISRLGPAYVTGGIDVIFPADADFDVKSFRAMFDPQIPIRFYHTKKDVGKKGDIEVLPFNDEVGPPATGTLIVDLGIGRGAASDVQGKKSIWLSKWPAVVSCYMPTATFTTSVRTNDGSTQLPANLRYFHEHYKEVYFFSSLRWHQPQFYVVARARASQPSWTPIGGDLEQGFRQGPFAKWVNFVVARSALSQIGNTWVAACDGLGVRMAPTFSAAMYMAGRIPDFSKGYAVKHGDKTLAGFYGGQQVAVVDEKIKAVPVDAYEATQDDFRPDGGDLLFADDRVSAIPMEPGTVEVIQPGEAQQSVRVEEADGRKGKSKQRRTSEKGGQKQGRGKSTRSALPTVAQTAVLPYDASSQATQGITTLRLHDVGEEQLPDAPPVTGHSGVGGVTFNL